MLNALDRVDPVPSIVGPATPIGKPDPTVATDADVLAAGDSVVRVLGSACGLGIEGSGWAAAPGLVVTNAHVVAGEEDTSVTTQDGDSLSATVVHFDPSNDLAILGSAPAFRPCRCRPRSNADSGRRFSAIRKTVPTPSPPPSSAKPAM